MSEILPEKGTGIVSALHWILALFVVMTQKIHNYYKFMFLIFGIGSLVVFFRIM